MSLLNKVFGGTKDKTEDIEVPPCPHTTLVPRWDSVDDIGKEDRAVRYICEGCEGTFTPEEAQQLRSTASERLPLA